MTTNDFSGKYMDIVGSYGTWKMYEWLAWAEVWCAFVTRGVSFKGVMPSDRQRFTPPSGCTPASTFTQLVYRLHEAIVYFVRPCD